MKSKWLRAEVGQASLLVLLFCSFSSERTGGPLSSSGTPARLCYRACHGLPARTPAPSTPPRAL